VLGGNMDIYGVCKEILERYGKEKQLDMVAEECSELIQAVMKNKRGRDNRANVLEEIADVELMIEQLNVIFDIGYTEILFIKEAKLQKVLDKWASQKCSVCGNYPCMCATD
jgi:NTP pyrophosphatase (non-canonical NTP hydrolase)